MSETRKLAAILVADVVGYSRLAGADEDRTLARLRGLRSDLIDPAIAAHHGRIVKRTGDGGLIRPRRAVSNYWNFTPSLIHDCHPRGRGRRLSRQSLRAQRDHSPRGPNMKLGSTS